jgi:hypothetical protein
MQLSPPLFKIHLGLNSAPTLCIWICTEAQKAHSAAPDRHQQIILVKAIEDKTGQKKTPHHHQKLHKSRCLVEFSFVWCLVFFMCFLVSSILVLCLFCLVNVLSYLSQFCLSFPSAGLCPHLCSCLNVATSSSSPHPFGILCVAYDILLPRKFRSLYHLQHLSNDPPRLFIETLNFMLLGPFVCVQTQEEWKKSLISPVGPFMILISGFLHRINGWTTTVSTSTGSEWTDVKSLGQWLNDNCVNFYSHHAVVPFELKSLGLGTSTGDIHNVKTFYLWTRQVRVRVF